MASHPLRILRDSGGSMAALTALLAEDVVFNSPILAKPVIGRELVAKVMQQSVQVRDGRYTDEFRQGLKTVLVWEGSIQGHKLQSFELIEDNPEGLIVARTVSMRPYPVVAIFRDAMHARLAGILGREYWDLS
jgi:uncharacterized protein with FMN-binding domain